MPYSKDNLKALPPATQSLTRKQKLKFVEIANSLLSQGMEEDRAIPLAISQAKKSTVRKSFEEVCKATTKDVEKLPNGNLRYRGQEFPGYNKPIRDSGDKQGKVLAKKGSEIKIVRFGDPDLADNQSAEQNDRFYDRFGGRPEIDDIFSALYWSAKWLWPKGQLKGKGPKPFATLNKSDLSLPIIKAHDDEQMISVEVVYEPYKLDAQQQWMSPETIRKACENFNKNLQTGNVKPNLFHAMESDQFEIIKTWINECDCFVGEHFVPEGTWIAKLKYKDENLWSLKKQGIVGGVSIGAKGRINPPVNKEENGDN